MSYYKDIYNDFPLRCGKLWIKLREQAKDKKLDVTFMLMTASGGLVTPWEHLKHNALGSDEEKRQPAFTPGNDEHYKEVLKAFTRAIDCAPAKSPLFRNLDIDQWKIRQLYKANEIINYVQNPDESIGRPYHLNSARDIIKIFRNALAHNNFHAFNRSGATEIDEIAFFSEDLGDYNEKTKRRDIQGYNVVSIPHIDFSEFLDEWFKLLKNIGLSNEYYRKILMYYPQEQEAIQSHAAN
jgi:hypothetical protein